MKYHGGCSFKPWLTHQGCFFWWTAPWDLDMSSPSPQPFLIDHSNLGSIGSAPQRYMWWIWPCDRKRETRWTRIVIISHPFLDMASHSLMLICIFLTCHCRGDSGCAFSLISEKVSSGFPGYVEEPYLSLVWVPSKAPSHWDLEISTNIF
jgi:hypothetical protein